MTVSGLHDTPSVVPTSVVQRAPVEEVAPVAPVPLPVSAPGAPVGGLVVGPADDPAEVEADTMADAALSRLRRIAVGDDPSEAPGHAHLQGPGPDHLMRSAAPSGSAVVGVEGGALDAATSSAINDRRSAGAPLDADLRRRMEGAFGASLSGVRLHTDDAAASLASSVSARAFTTGQDVFFGRGEFAPGTPSGDHVLAHELAHTLQAGGGARRLSVQERQGGIGGAVIRRRVKFGPGVFGGRVIAEIIIPRPTGTDKKTAKDVSQNAYHTSAYTILIETITNRLRGRTYLDAIAEIKRLIAEAEKLPGIDPETKTADKKVKAHKKDLDDKVAEAENETEADNFGYCLETACLAWLTWRNSLRYTRHEDSYGAKSGDAEGQLAAGTIPARDAVITKANALNKMKKVKPSDRKVFAKLCKNFTDYAIGPLDLRNIHITATKKVKKGGGGAKVQLNEDAMKYLEIILKQHYMTLMMRFPELKSKTCKGPLKAAFIASILESGAGVANAKADDFTIDHQVADDVEDRLEKFLP